MMSSDHSRRSMIKGIGIATAAGVFGAASAQAVPAVPVEGEIWSNEYWAKKDDIPLWMFRKRIGAPKPGEPARPVVFFVHGSSVTSRVFDLTVPGKGEYSLLNTFARYGFDCWTMDHENYGKSGRTSGNADIASGVEDLKAAVEVIARETGQGRYHFVGESSGALRAGAFAMAAPERIDRLVFAAFTYKGEGSPTLAKRAEQLAYYRSHNMRKRDRDMDPLDRDPRQARHVGPRRGRAAGRCRDAVRRPDPDRHLSRHDRQFAGGASGEGAGAGAAGPRRI
ncbi:alpha/beta hydrolase [Bradyrhizobium brasilense]|uniref:Alpha/beta fold hydrolase n=1 Tax=Bradyrhizobium brasilense TaxID=1419277 RepID=A0ABY8JJ60_9BRAD|nr:alpha/beta fold hydrolase [Bradyrhizobium brasilense]WFU65677.1 alpha/beta fold hydrolase [Bradyrhizobium brasilense]